MVTETDAVARALDVGAQRWPGTPRGQLIARLLEEARRSITEEDERTREARIRAIREAAGGFDTCYPAGYREDLRDEWPE